MKGLVCGAAGPCAEAEERPCGREGFSLSSGLAGGAMVLFGGRCRRTGRLLNDTWLLQPEEGRWRRLQLQHGTRCVCRERAGGGAGRQETAGSG